MPQRGYISQFALQKAFKLMNFQYELDEIDAIFYYVDKDRDAKISYAEFEKAMNRFGESEEAQEQQQREDSRKQLSRKIFGKIIEVLRNEGINYEQAFKSMDLDRDNKISVRDMKKSFLMMNLKVGDGDVTSIVEYLDRDNDGCLNFKEFVAALESAAK